MRYITYGSNRKDFQYKEPFDDEVEPLIDAEVLKLTLSGETVTLHIPARLEYVVDDVASIYEPLDKAKIINYIGQETFDDLLLYPEAYDHLWFKLLEEGDPDIIKASKFEE